jgi:hypothetical protein
MLQWRLGCAKVVAHGQSFLLGAAMEHGSGFWEPPWSLWGFLLGAFRSMGQRLLKGAAICKDEKTRSAAGLFIFLVRVTDWSVLQENRSWPCNRRIEGCMHLPITQRAPLAIGRCASGRGECGTCGQSHFGRSYLYCVRGRGGESRGLPGDGVTTP